MRVPKLRKHSFGQGRVTLGGRTYYFGKFGSEQCQSEYRRLVGEWLASGGVIVRENGTSDLAVAEMLLACVAWAKVHYGKGSGEFDRIRRIVKLARKDDAKWPTAEFGYQQFEALRAALVSTVVGRKYVNESMKRLVCISRWSASPGLDPASCATRSRHDRTTPARADHWTRTGEGRSRGSRRGRGDTPPSTARGAGFGPTTVPDRLSSRGNLRHSAGNGESTGRRLDDRTRSTQDSTSRQTASALRRPKGSGDPGARPAARR